jgi:hypothetical protein
VGSLQVGVRLRVQANPVASKTFRQVENRRNKEIGGSVKSNKAVWGLVALVVLTVVVVSACRGAAPEPAQPEAQPVSIDAETLLQGRCTECHAQSRTTSAKKSAEEWEGTVARMVDHGANLNDEEQTILVDYLAQTYGP